MRELELSNARFDAEKLMPNTAVVIRNVEGRSPTGAKTFTPVDIATHRCRIGPVSGRSAVVASKITATKAAVVSIPAVTDVKEQDKLRVDGLVWEVQQVLDRDDRYEVIKRVVVSR
jgi:SPP1 family predicted phage head-tail adaptor